MLKVFDNRFPFDWKDERKPYYRHIKWCVTFLCVLKHLNNPLPKDIIKLICNEYLVFKCRKYVEFYFQYFSCWKIDELNTFDNLMTRKINVLHYKDERTDHLLIGICVSFLRCDQRVKILYKEKKFDKIETVIGHLGWRKVSNNASSINPYGFDLLADKYLFNRLTNNTSTGLLIVNFSK
jgi:hypothetical protein